MGNLFCPAEVPSFEVPLPRNSSFEVPSKDIDDISFKYPVDKKTGYCYTVNGISPSTTPWVEKISDDKVKKYIKAAVLFFLKKSKDEFIKKKIITMIEEGGYKIPNFMCLIQVFLVLKLNFMIKKVF